MRSEETILDEYRKGDFHKRLNLYLQYRDLRSRFTQIDSGERASPQAVVSGKKPSRRPGSRILKSLQTGFRLEFIPHLSKIPPSGDAGPE